MTTQVQPTAESLANLMRAVHIDLYQDKSYDAKRQAQQNLKGRTHYADPDTLAYFNARIVTCKILENGLILGLLESVAHPAHGRIYRPRFFDFRGFVIEVNEDANDGIGEFRKSGDAGRKLFWHQANQIDAVAVTLAALKSKMHRAAQQAADIGSVLSRSVESV